MCTGLFLVSDFWEIMKKNLLIEKVFGDKMSVYKDSFCVVSINNSVWYIMDIVNICRINKWVKDVV